MSIEQMFAENARVMAEAAQTLPATLERIAQEAAECLKRGGRIFACGNGGSAADAQHLVAELVGRYRDERRALAAVALTADSALVSAVANDYGYEHVFSRQVEGLARCDDLLFAISTSGNSANVVRAAEVARDLGVQVIALTGASGGRLAAHADIIVRAPSAITARIQEVHGLCIHSIVERLDQLIAGHAAP